MTSSRQPLRRSMIKGKVSIAERRSNYRKKAVAAKIAVVDVVEPVIVKESDFQLNEIKVVDEVVEVSLPPIVEEIKNKKKSEKKKETVNG